MSPDQLKARSYAAKALIDDPTLNEAWKSIEAELIEEWSKPLPWGDTQATAKREAIYAELQMLRRIRQKLSSFAATKRD